MDPYGIKTVSFVDVINNNREQTAGKYRNNHNHTQIFRKNNYTKTSDNSKETSMRIHSDFEEFLLKVSNNISNKNYENV